MCRHSRFFGAGWNSRCNRHTSCCLELWSRPFMSFHTPAPVPIQPPSIIDRSLPLLLVIFLTPSPSPVDSVVISLNVTRVMLPFQDFLVCHDTPAGKPVSLRMFLANYVSGETPNHNSHAEEKSVKCACNSAHKHVASTGKYEWIMTKVTWDKTFLKKVVA